MKNKNFWESEIYSKNQQWNSYPFTQLISEFSRVTQGFSKRGNVLEVGCGVGNNLIAISQLNYQCYGVDISETAIREAKNRAEDKGLNIDFREVDIQTYELAADYYDFILDRSTITVLPYSSVHPIIENIYQSLKKDSYFLGFDWISKKTDDLSFGTTKDNNTFTNFKKGKYKYNNSVTAFTYHEIKDIFNKFSEVEIQTISNISDKSQNIFETFSIIAKK